MLDRRYERMMSGKEKRAFEKEKLSHMTRREKLEYLWMYYKAWLLVPVILIAVICLGVQIYQSRTTEVLLYLTVTDLYTEDQDFTDLEDTFKDYIGADGKKQTIEVNSSLSASTYQGEIAFSTLVGAQSVDVVLCTQEFYDSYADMLELEGTREPDKKLTELTGADYSPVCVCIAENAPHKENARQFVRMILEQ